MELNLNRTAVGLALASTSLDQNHVRIGWKLLDPKAKPWDDDRVLDAVVNRSAPFSAR